MKKRMPTYQKQARSFFMTILGGTLLGGGSLLAGCAVFGTLPSPEEHKVFEKSPQYEKDSAQFVNRQQQLINDMRAKNTKKSSWWRFLFGPKGDRVPSKPFPVISPNMEEFLAKGSDVKVIWFGHSSFMLNLDGKIVLVDPVFSNYASPISLAVKRFQPPPLKLEDLPPIDYIIISHDHYDHLDMKTIKFFKKKDTPFVVPIGVGSHLVGWGIDRSRITELDWWESKKTNDFEFIATPAQHFSGRSFKNRNKTLWAGWVIKSAKHKVFYSGDTGYDIHFKEIGKRHGPFDVVFLDSAQYNERWSMIHMFPEEAIQASMDLNAKSYFPIHWGAFDISYHAWHEPIDRVYKTSQVKKVYLIVPKIGEVVEINDTYKTTPWWEELKEVKD